MKIGNILAAGLVGILAASCADNTCHIEGVVESAQAGDTLLFARMENDTFVPTDTLILDEGGKFTVNEPCDSTIIASYFFYDKQSQEAYSNVFFIESGKVSMRIGPDGKVSGTENNDLYQALTDSIYGLHEQMNAIYSMEPKDSMGMPLPGQEAENRLIALEQQASQLLEENVRKHIGKPLGYFLLLSCYDMFEPKDILELAEKVSADYQNSPALQYLKGEAVKSNATANGQTFIDVTMPSMDGGELKLSEVIKANKLTLVDCWASWCAPCRAEMPHVVALYEKYHKLGLEIVGVSFDDDAEAWKKAVKDMGMTWPQVSELNSWDNVMTEKYGVSSIPYTILIDQDGTILGQQLRGGELEKAIMQHIEK